MEKKKFVGPILIITAGVLWGLMGLFVRNLDKYGITSMQIVALRAVFTAIMMTAVTLVYDRKLFKIKLRDCWCFFGTGICSIVFFNFCYFRTITLTSLSAAAVLLYTAPIMVMIMSLFLFKEKLTARKIIAAAVAFVGCAMVTGAADGSLALNAIGVLTGLGSAFGYALYTIFGEYALKRGYNSITITLYTFVFAAVGVLPLADLPDLTEKISVNPQIIGWGAVLALVVTVLPYLVYTLGLRTVEAGKASVMATIEPVVATLVGVIVFDESLSALGIIGIIFVAVSLAMLNIKTEKENSI
ncbi:MAG: EamA family transporter [Oscillospiraceae bacterium]|nr:EamA family transporter [Oscillospiraceae bacterium]